MGVGRYTVALTADHGVAPIPERAAAEGLDAGRIPGDAFATAIDRSLSQSLGTAGAVARVMNSDVYLQPGVYEQLRARPPAIEALRAAVTSIPGVLSVYTRTEVAANRFDDDPIGRRLARSYFPARSGDLMVVPRPYWLVQAAGTSHGTGHGYDTRVPILLMGAGIAKGEYLAPASPTDVAPTLAFLSGVTLAQAQGRVLREALGSTKYEVQSTKGRSQK